MSETETITFQINQKLKNDYKRAILNDRDNDNMTSDLIAHIESKVERDKKRNQ